MLTSAARPGRAVGVRGLLVEVHGALPAPVDEHAREQPEHQGVEGAGLPRPQPREGGVDRARGPVVAEHLDQRDHGEQQQRAHLSADQQPRRERRELGADHADGGHGDDDHRRQDRDRYALADRLALLEGRQRRLPADDVEEVVGGHVGQRADHDQARGAHGEARDPAHARADRAGDPGEVGAAVRVGAVHVVEARRDQEHRDEGHEQDARCLKPDAHHDDPDDRRQRVGRCRRRDPDGQRVPEADRAFLEALVARRGCHVTAPGAALALQLPLLLV